MGPLPLTHCVEGLLIHSHHQQVALPVQRLPGGQRHIQLGRRQGDLQSGMVREVRSEVGIEQLHSRRQREVSSCEDWAPRTARTSPRRGLPSMFFVQSLLSLLALANWHAKDLHSLSFSLTDSKPKR